jgi:hypothetical protein
MYHGSWSGFLKERDDQNNEIREILLRQNPDMKPKEVDLHLKSAAGCKRGERESIMEKLRSGYY